MTIRRATRSDIAALAAIAERSYRSAFASLLDEDVLASRNAFSFAARFRESLERMTVAEENGSLLGFLLMTEGHIDMLFMDPQAAGKGAGTLLLREAESRGAATLECFRDNRAARQFYERRGWTLSRAYDRDFAGKNHSFVLYARALSS